MAYTTIDDPTAYFQTKLWTGNGGTQSITLDGLNDMQPDWVWIKQRSEVRGHNIQDSVRGATKYLDSRSNGAEATVSNTLTSFDSNGFSLGSYDDVNKNSQTYVAWNWKAGTAFTNDASATGIGSIDSSGSVNETAGFSIVSYTGSGSAATVKHGLSTTPNVMIIKNRPATDGRDWQFYSPVNDPTDALALNQTDPTGDSDVYWNDTAPTSSVFSVKDGATNKSGDAIIGYIFSERKGYSKFSTYVGNGSSSANSGTYVYLGFKPALVIVKNTTSVEGWQIWDNKRSSFNGQGSNLSANSTGAESTGVRVHFFSNGYQLVSSGADQNSSGDTFMYMAFAESPFVTSTGVPATAR